LRDQAGGLDRTIAWLLRFRPPHFVVVSLFISEKVKRDLGTVPSGRFFFVARKGYDNVLYHCTLQA
jgi:hypothetical protein